MTVSKTVLIVLTSACLLLGSPTPVSRMFPPCRTKTSTWILDGCRHCCDALSWERKVFKQWCLKMPAEREQRQTMASNFFFYCFILFRFAQKCAKNQPTHKTLQHFLNTTAARPVHGSWTRVVLHMESGGKTRLEGGGGGAGLSVLGLFRGLGGLCGAAAYHSARRPKVFTYWLVPCNLDDGNGRAISLASKWATHLNTRGQKGSGTRIPPLISLSQRLPTNISWSSTNKHLSTSLGMIHSREG